MIGQAGNAVSTAQMCRCANFLHGSCWSEATLVKQKLLLIVISPLDSSLPVCEEFEITLEITLGQPCQLRRYGGTSGLVAASLKYFMLESDLSARVQIVKPPLEVDGWHAALCSSSEARPTARGLSESISIGIVSQSLTDCTLHLRAVHWSTNVDG